VKAFGVEGTEMLSVTCTEKFSVPELVGVPVITPVVGFSINAPSEPEVTDHV